MFLFVLMADFWFRNLTQFKLVSCGSYVLNIIFVTSDQVDYVLRFTMKVLSDKIAPACTSAAKMV